MNRVFRSFWCVRPEGGTAISIGLVFAMTAGAVGAAVDYSSAHNRRSDVQRAADAAALAGAANPDMTIQAIKDLAAWDVAQAPSFENAVVSAERGTDGIVTVEIRGDSKTYILGIVGVNGVEVSAESKAAYVPLRGGKLEVALVLDTTESMADDMAQLRSAAKDLADSLFEIGGDENVKVSVVPYVASVNIGSGGEQMAWMDTAANAPYHSQEMRDRTLTNCRADDAAAPSSGGGTNPPSCWDACGCPGTPACGGGSDGASLIGNDATRYAGSLLQSLLGSPAAASPLPHPAPDPESCPVRTPDKINYFDLYDAIPNADWMGCVEARPAPLDVTDVAAGADPASRFVPYFWPDEVDYLDDKEWANNYIDDTLGPVLNDDIQFIPAWSGRNRVNIWKYDDATMADISESSPDVSGPNRSCPDPMLRLTADADIVDAKISSLTHRKGGGTIISEGLMWGWRALSPGAPFSEGVQYDDETRKIIIILSDGANQVIARNKSDGSPGDETLGDYTAYGFAHEYNQDWPSRGLIDTSADTSTPYFDQVRVFLNERTASACANVKSAGTDRNKIEIYTVLVGDSDADTEEVMASCATTRSNHYKEVSNMQSLQETFEEVGSQIAGSGSSRLVN